MDDQEDRSLEAERLARQQAIGSELKEVFGRVEDEPVPEALRRLAARLDEKLAGGQKPVRLALVPTRAEPDDEER